MIMIYTVSKKTVQNCFCQNFAKFPPTLIIFGKQIAQRIGLCHRYHTNVDSSSARAAIWRVGQ